ncbi:MAG: helix-turn-helix transcriptional regulator [Vicinamibacterales bacterium]
MLLTGRELRQGRERKDWTQAELARRLGVSQGYVSLMESDERAVPRSLASRLVPLLGLSASHLPLEESGEPLQAERVAAALGTLGYAGFAHLRRRVRLNPAELVVRTLGRDRLDARLVEALPWVLLHFPDMDWAWLVSQAKLHDLQNRLGCVVTVARALAERLGHASTTATLRTWEEVLERSRLQLEDAFGGEALTDAERRWLRTHRSGEAARWNMLSRLSADSVTHAQPAS